MKLKFLLGLILAWVVAINVYLLVIRVFGEQIGTSEPVSIGKSYLAPLADLKTKSKFALKRSTFHPHTEAPSKVIKEPYFRINHNSSLPKLSDDASEFVFGALIERQFSQWDLYITTLLLCRHMLDSNLREDILKVNPTAKQQWQQAFATFPGITYTAIGRRSDTHNFSCRIQNSPDAQPYTAKAFFVPNRLTSDSNVNRRLDILRCAMQNSKEAYLTLARSGHDVQVEILRGAISIINFTIPWGTRKTGFMLSSPETASKLDGWRGFNNEAYASDASKAFETKADDVHICMPGTKRFPSKDVIPLFLEFISHHSLVGAGHIYFPVSVGWKSVHMELWLQLFRSYIDEEKLSVISHSGDGLDMVHSVAGLTWSRFMIKVMQVNMCLYESKGVADYLLVLDIDEFFIPRPGFNTIGDVISAVDTRDPLALVSSPRNQTPGHDLGEGTSGRGWADGESHPLCFMALESEVIANDRIAVRSWLRPWVGERYQHGAEPKSSLHHRRYSYSKVILPTRVIFQGGLSVAGACKLSEPWDGCGDEREDRSETQFCGDLLERDAAASKRAGRTTNSTTHSFYEVVTERDAKRLSSEEHAVVYHFMYYSATAWASEASMLTNNSYASLFFPRVIQDLKARNLHLAAIFPDTSKHNAVNAEEGWLSASSIITASSVVTTTAPIGPVTPAMPMSTQPVETVIDAQLHQQLLSKIEKSQSGKKVVELPNFAVDLTDYALSGMIERVSDSYDLWVSTFFVSRNMLFDPHITVSTLSREYWNLATSKFRNVSYRENGEREQPPNYYCKITHAAGYEPYVVSGRFVPNKLTPDSNSNRRTDIFRCKMKNTEQAYMQLARSDEVMEVEIVRGDVTVLAYRIPWKSRTAGFMLEFPPDASVFDPWKGFDKSKPGVWKYDNLYMCVPGLETPPSKTSLPLYLEFIQHHLLLGVDHMFIGALFNWESVHMKQLLRILKSYIAANELSVVSTSGDGFDGIYSTAGLVWVRDNVKNFHVNMCTYYAKGTADYVGVWDFDERFIPFGENKNIIDVIRSKESPVPIPYIHPLDARPEDVMPHWRSGRGLADNDGHPFCYIALDSVVTLRDQSIPVNDPAKPWLFFDLTKRWIGERFSHGAESTHGLAFKKSIRPTRTIFQGGLHLAGACRLPYPYNGCDSDVDFCWSEGWEKGEQYRLTKFLNGSTINFNLNHRFDEIVLDQDAKLVDQKTEAVISRVLYYKPGITASDHALDHRGEYASRFFPAVHRALDERNLTMPVTIPEVFSKPFPEADSTWKTFDEIRKDIDRDPTNVSNFALPGAPPLSFSTILPQWASDRTEVFLGSMIERVSDSWDLYLATFLLCHNMIEHDENGYAAYRAQAQAVELWTAAVSLLRKASYTLAGRRKGARFFCKIRNSADSPEYLVPAEFVPNRLTPDVNANNRLDILRCKVEDSEKAYMAFARSKTDNIHVQILRDSDVLISFKVPWDSRVNGKTLSTPPASSATSFDVWKGFNKSAPGVWTHDKIYMCVPGIDTAPSRKSLPVFLEFMQHHLLIGVEHIFLTFAFHWESVHMQRYLRLLRDYIDVGSVSVTSHSVEGFDFIYTFLEASWDRDAFKIFQVNMCVYLAKGTADYVGVWDVDEFFIPKGKSKNLIDVLAMLSPRDGDHSPEMASGENHPFCYVQLRTQVIANRAAVPEVDMQHPWMGERFGHGPERAGSRAGNQFSFKKSIIPTRRIFQVALHMSGACRLESPWSGCDRGAAFCNTKLAGPRRSLSKDPADKSPRSTHQFNEVVEDADTRLLNIETEGVIYHFLVYRYYHAVAKTDVLQERNDYSAYYFNETIGELRRRSLDLAVLVPEISPTILHDDKLWTQLP